MKIGPPFHRPKEWLLVLAMSFVGVIIFMEYKCSRTRFGFGLDFSAPIIHRSYKAESELFVGELRRRAEKPSLIVVLAGGVTASGTPHESVLRRLDAAIAVSKSAGRPVPILCNGGGTTHKSKWVDGDGFSTPEAVLMARYLIRHGVPPHDILIEGYSDDTLGNALMARTMIMQWMALKTVVVITSDFHQLRTRLIYEWALALPPGEFLAREHYAEHYACIHIHAVCG